MEIGIFDTNLIKKMTRVGKRDQYDKVILWLQGMALINFDSSKVIFTPGGVLEFLGVGTITIKPDLDIQELAFNHIRKNTNKFTEISVAKGWILKNLERKLYATGQTSKASLRPLLAREIQFVDDSLKDWVHGLLFDKIMNGENRRVIANRIALDNLQRVTWSEDIILDIHTTFMADVHHALQYKVSYNTTRSLWLLWRKFNHSLVIVRLRQEQSKQRKGLTQPNPTHLSIKDQIQNLKDFDDFAKFKSTEDFVDTEAIHYAIVGRFDQDQLKPILFCTCDPVEAVLTRLLFFKWLYVASFRLIQRDDNVYPEMSNGKIACFDFSSNAKYLIDVSTIPSDMDFLSSKKIADWLDEKKAEYSV